MVYKLLFPKPNPTDPIDLHHHINKNLVPEVRQEIARFYGNMSLMEAQYPGLDYTRSGHRNRLVAFQWHRRLFRVFDLLRLSNYEINTLCTWEGTKWAKDKYERDHRTKIRDTTWDDIEVFRRISPSAVICSHYLQFQQGFQDTGDADMEGLGSEEIEQGEIELSEDSEDDLVSQSVGVALNQRLLAASEARARGEDAVIDPDWEQWMKEAAERRGLPIIDTSISLSRLGPSRRSHLTSGGFSQPHASAGQMPLANTPNPRHTVLPQPIYSRSRVRLSTPAEAATTHPYGSTSMQ